MPARFNDRMIVRLVANVPVPRLCDQAAHALPHRAAGEQRDNRNHTQNSIHSDAQL
jgi:hypothetical protein